MPRRARQMINNTIIPKPINNMVNDSNISWSPFLFYLKTE